MMITGDKLQTAENIGYLARLIKENDIIYRLSANIENIVETTKQIVFEIEENNKDVSIIIEGKQISKIIKE